ncbi:MAG: DUF3043 domain-containing protein [Actinomycetales bacterium]
MFGRKKQEAAEVEDPVVPDRPGAKNRPTPTRREREQARKRPMVPEDRKADKAALRERMRQERVAQRQALYSGDEKALGPRDAGKYRRFVRDVVDGRRNLGEYYLLLALLAIILVLGPQLIGMNIEDAARVQLISTAVLWGTILIVVLDSFRLSRMLRRRLKERFGEDFNTRGHVSYGVSRSLQIRRWRLPKPAIAHGQQPRP